ncbi:hypothetical protein GUJ93_ZPchr0006g46341 [Zizania palustris]|uniref:Uncharacterized protein n=1 Tax=Zizania palustris TaxID=103762 RepID=A0A8J5S9D3_ZIZPA|nr:hypothetical protein GUJ93_ZPchr0006g46341 [Zizania palustris]KAG8070940.1 hypothetical protein GUJ93_ZPchr0006g46341 [Zizania palustris]
MSMPRSDCDGEDDVFFDACDDIRSPMEASLSVCCSTSEAGYELWASEPISVSQRRQRFLKGMGFLESFSTGTVLDHWHGEITADCSFHDLEERFSSVRSSFHSCFSDNIVLATDCAANSTRDVDNGRRFSVHEDHHNDLSGIPEEVGSDKMLPSNNSEVRVGLSRLVRKFFHSGFGGSRAKQSEFKSLLWERFTRRKGPVRIAMDDVHARSLNSSRLPITKVHQQNKKWMDFSAVYMCQEIQAHKGLIRVMKVSSSGWYLASGGEDCVVRIWQIKEIESSPSLYRRDTPPLEYMNINKGVKSKLGKGRNRSLAIIPKKVFSITETPLHEFHGHTSDILDMAWSKSDFLLTSSKDKTIRMWKVACNGCLAVFKHGDYVTCVQFNPVDERYFISGSIDGKVRVWSVSEKRVIDWDDTRDIITAISYRPDGKGFVVGSVTGTRFYDQSGKNIEMSKQMGLKRKKKSAANKITNLQFCEEDPSRIIITSADSKIRVSEGHGIVKKFEGQRCSKALLPPSLTSDGRFLVSAGMDSNVRIWNFDANGKRPVRSCEVFFSEGVTAVAAWTRMHAGGNEGEGEGGSTTSSSSWSSGTRTPTADADESTLCLDRDCCSFGTWFFADGMRRSATWPEEKLLPSLKYINCDGMDDCRSKVAAAWNMVVLTGSGGGVIRAFHNYGLPARLWHCHLP